MALAPVHRLKKADIIWLAKSRCKHGHTFLEHYNCFLKEQPDQHKIGFFDIETSGFQADFGIMFTYCIKPHGEDKILTRTVTKEELAKCLDKKVVEQCVKDIQKFDRLVGFYSTRFDVPFLRTRAVYHGIPFPEYGQLLHKDVYYIVRNKFKLGRNRQESACRALIGEVEKNHIDSMKWIKALQGDKKSLFYITDHCKRDVRDLERLYDKVIGYTKVNDTSI